MSQNKHYFKGNELYYLKDVIPYIKKKNPSLEIPDCWETGGSLNDKVRTEYGILPSWTNELEGRGHREKYSGSQMYSIAANLVQDLKDGNIRRQKSRTPTPIEALASGEVLEVSEGIVFPSIPVEVVPVLEPTPKDELEKAIRDAAEALETCFHNFMNAIIEAYMGGES